jgi:small subunit ribosomal protein S8
MANVEDTISDMMSRIDNAQQRRYSDVEIPGSSLKLEVAKVLEEYGYINGVEWEDTGPQGLIRIDLRYDENEEPLIQSMERESRPARRHYVGVDEIPEVLNGLGIAVLSTSKGVMAGRDAKAANIGGEVLCSIY